MRKKAKASGLTVVGISGTHVITLGFDVTKAKRKGLLGFAIHREDHTEDEAYWLRGFKTFKNAIHKLRPGQLESTLESPIQGFWWGDYTAKPDHKYTFKVVPMYGHPRNLKEGTPVSLTINTESEDTGTHAIYFNRGVAGSQAYARKFDNKNPKDVPNNAAYKWLSRGLEEAIIGFIDSAKDKSYSLHASVYEFSHIPVYEAFKRADKRGVKIKIIYDDRKKTPGTTTKKLIKKMGITKLTKPRRSNKSSISHNKYIILSKNDKPLEVWTGSTNYTGGGIYGQSNVGHLVRDKAVANKYMEYWKLLFDDPKTPALRPQLIALTPDPGDNLPKNSITPIFSPRPNSTKTRPIKTVLDWYTEKMNKATETVAFTAAFGVNKGIAKVLGKKRDFLRFILLEKRGNTFNEFNKTWNNLIALGSIIDYSDIPEEKRLRGYLEEHLTGLNTWVNYLHTKYMLVDPLSNKPTVISGSANFSNASTVSNDENMLIINGDTRVADIYFGEFLRLFNHFYFRSFLKKMKDPNRASYLTPDDSWTDRYYNKTSYKSKERELFVNTYIPKK